MLEIRLVRRSELDAVVAMLAQDSFGAVPVNEVASDAQIRAFEIIAAHPDNEIIVALLEGRIVGTLQLSFIPGLSFDGAWRAQVEGVRVRSDLRNQRIGSELMEWVFARARERGCKLVQLTSNVARTDARRFYERLGFAASHTGMKLYL
jgi:GNAT superfamily N-acetyltransferase